MIAPGSTKESKHYLTGGKLAFENAKALFAIAVKAEEEHEFGVCKSLMILSCEEAVKGYMLLIQSIDGKTIHPKFRMLMKNHKAKHHIIHSILSMIEERINELPMAEKRIRNDHSHLTDEEYQRDILSSKYYIAEKAFTECLRALKVDWKKAESWWMSANFEKNKGLYTEERNGKWESPTRIKAKEIVLPKKYLKGMFLYIEHQISLLDDQELFIYFASKKMLESQAV